jgi:hypothetical protein
MGFSPFDGKAWAMPDTIECKTRCRARNALRALALLLPNGAFAHDSWLNGFEVDPITKGVCCGVDDTKLVDDLVRANANGSIWFIDQPDMLIPQERIQPSPDGHWWRSMTTYEAGFTTIRCVYGPYTY